MSQIIHREGTGNPQVRLKNYNSKKKKVILITFSFADAAMHGQTLGSTVLEVVKHLLYLRNQLPMPFAMFKGMLSSNSNNATPVRLSLRSRVSKMRTCIQNLSLIFSSMSKMFERRYEVKRVVLMLGSTIVSPKESFVITCGSSCYGYSGDDDDGDQIAGSVVRKCLRNIVTNTDFSDLPSIAFQRVHILVGLGEIPGDEMEDDITEVFAPRMNFCLPEQRGSIHRINLSTNDGGESSGESVSEHYWLHATLPVKGFKDIIT